MRLVRIAVLMSIVCKVIAVGMLWRDATALAESTEGEGRGGDASEGGNRPKRSGENRPGTTVTARPEEVPPEVLARARGFRALLEAVDRRSAELDEREQRVGAREAALREIEKTIAAQVTRLEGLRQGVQGECPPSSGGPSGEAIAKVAGEAGIAVNKVYESMAPEDAARILDQLDERTLRAILGAMKEKRVGAILAAMRREQAVAITRSLAAQSPPAPKPAP